MTTYMNVNALRTARSRGLQPSAPGETLRRADLSGADLSRSNLREANLSEANLSRSNLRNADLRGANLRGANLRGANLRGAELSGADLRGANLTKVDLREADLPKARLQYAALRGADMSAANLRNADLNGVDLYATNLDAADLTGANVSYLRAFGVLTFGGTPSGLTTFQPTPEGWLLRVGCWSGTPMQLAELISQDDDWPEAEGDEIKRRRPYLSLVVANACLVMAEHPSLINDLRAKWL